MGEKEGELARLVDAFVTGPMGDEEIAALVPLARSAADHTTPAEALRLVTRAFFDAIDPRRRTAISKRSVDLLQELYDDARGGRLGAVTSAAAATRAGSVASTYFPIMAGDGDDWTWRRVDSGEGLGEHWRSAFGLSGSFAMLGGCDALFISPHASGKTDPLNFPVRLASGYYADPAEAGLVEQDPAGKGMLQSCRTALARAISHDNGCLTTENRSSAVCANRQVTRIGRTICDHYDGVGELFLAECDCIKGSNAPSEQRLYASCLSSLARNEFRQNRWAWERNLEPEDCKRLNVNDASQTSWGLPKLPSRISDPIAQNVIARHVNRSYRKLDRFAGFPVACFYPACSDRYSSYAYTDAEQTFADQSACPDVRCSASINVNWVSKDVTITGNALEVRCDGGPCLVDGLARCKNGGRCVPVPGVSIDAEDSKQVLCNCSGTGFKGPTCEEPTGEPATGTDDASRQTLDKIKQSTQTAAQILAANATENEDMRVYLVVGLWALAGLLVLSVLAVFLNLFRRKG
jgi:hypothetical protein